MRLSKDNFCLHAYQVSLFLAGVPKSKNQGIAVAPHGHPDSHEQHLVVIATSLFYPSLGMQWEYVRGIQKGGLEIQPHGRAKEFRIKKNSKY